MERRTSNDSDTPPSRRKRRGTNVIRSDEEDSDSSVEVIRRNKRTRIIESDTESDSSIEIVRRRRKKVPVISIRVPSEDESSSSGLGMEQRTSNDSDTPPSRRKRRGNNVIRSDEEDSDSSVEVIRRNNRTRIIESDTESDSSIEIVRRKRKKIPRVPSEDESSSSGLEIFIKKSPSKKPIKSDSENEIDKYHLLDDENAERCPICFVTFKTQEVGVPETCHHSFCGACLLEWSNNMNTCPVDRRRFNLIYIRKHYNGELLRQVEVVDRIGLLENTEVTPTFEIFQQAFDQSPETFCELCLQTDREDTMLLCDGCDSGYHMQCLEPPLFEVPVNAWYCPICSDPNVHYEYW